MKRNIIHESKEIINNKDFIVSNIIKKQWSSPDDYWYVSILQRQKDNSNVLDSEGNSIFVGNGKKWIDGDFSDNRIGYVIVSGNTVEEAIDSLLNAKVTIFDSWIPLIDNQKTIECNDNNFGSIISVCRRFNARAYISMYKRSLSKNSSKDLPQDIYTPNILKNELTGKTDTSSRERIFDFVSTHKPRTNLPLWFIDCDEESDDINEYVYNYIVRNCGVEPQCYQTHNGYHYLIDMNWAADDAKEIKKIKKGLNTFLYNLYGNEGNLGKRGKQLNPITIENDKKLILYSEVGVEGRNVEHPDWQTIRDYPVPELRRRRKKSATVKPIKKEPRKVFSIGTNNGRFECDATDTALLYDSLKKRFPNFKDDVIKKLMNNPGNYIMKENKIQMKSIVEALQFSLNKFINEELGENLEGEAFKRTEPVYYSGDDKLSLVKDPYDSLDKSQQHGNLRNFAIRRNGKVYWVARSLAVQCCVFCKDRNGEWCLLASKRGGSGDRSGQWNIVGGFLDYGEDLEMAVSRECREETGVELPKENIKYLGHHAPVGDGPVDIFFKAFLNGTTDMYAPTLENCEGFGTERQESTDVGWIPISQLGNYNFVSRQRKYIQQLASELSAGNSGNEVYANFVNSLGELLKSGMINNNIYNRIISLVNK